MVYVRLAKEWSDSEGTVHDAGTMVDVDAGTLAELEAAGIVAGPGDGGDTESWPGPTATQDGGDSTESWPGPTV
jgi:hypothetical protein